jgi:hypothetical protein
MLGFTMGLQPVVSVYGVTPLSPNKVGVHCLLYCGCEARGKVHPDKLMEIIPGRYMLAGVYPCPKGCKTYPKAKQ